MNSVLRPVIRPIIKRMFEPEDLPVLALVTNAQAIATLASPITYTLSPNQFVFECELILPAGATERYLYSNTNSGSYLRVRSGSVVIRTNGSAGPVTITAPALTANVWHTIKVVVNAAGTAEVFINNASQGSLATGGTGVTIATLLTTFAGAASFANKIRNIKFGTLAAPEQHKYVNTDPAATTWPDVGTVGGRTATLSGTYTWETV